MRVMILLPADSDARNQEQRTNAAREYLSGHRLKRVLARHGVNEQVIDNCVHADLARNTSGSLPEDIYCEILLGFDFPIRIYKENNARASESA